MKKPADIDSYIAAFPPDTRLLLQQVRAAIRAVAPLAEETISYAMPAFRLNGRVLVYFAGFKQHIGIYPIPTGDARLDKAMVAHKAGKGTLRFSLDEELPLRLISRVVKQRVKETSILSRKRG